MKLEEVVIDLQQRVMHLNDKVDQLNEEIQQLRNNKQSALNSESKSKTKIIGKSNKALLIQGVVDAVSDIIPAENIRRGTREEGSGLIITKDNKQIKICLRGSGHYQKSDVSERMLYTGFSSLGKDTIEDVNGNLLYDFYLFGINTGNEENLKDFEFFIFDQKQFMDLLSQKPHGSTYYFYFGETIDHHYIDDREKSKVVKIDKAHNNWEIIKKAYQNLK